MDNLEPAAFAIFGKGVLVFLFLETAFLARAHWEDSLAMLLIEKGLITGAEFMQKLSAERAGYRAVLQKIK